MVTHQTDRITLARLPSGIEVQTELHRYRGEKSGPTVYIQAAQHGREINGVEVIRQLSTRFEEAEIGGEVLMVPVANPLTFDRVSYTTPEILDHQNPNMNRVWPGDEEGTIHQQMAASLWDIAGNADVIIDLHTGGPNIMSHVVVTKDDNESLALAKAFGTDLILCEEAHEEADDEWHERGFTGKLRVTAHSSGISCITPELAHNKQFVDDAIDLGFKGVLRVLDSLGVISTAYEEGDDQIIARNHLGRVTADNSGLFRADPGKAIGQRVDDGEHIGVLYDPTTFETIKEATTNHAGILYSLQKEPVVTAGQQLFSVALEIEDE